MYETVLVVAAVKFRVVAVIVVVVVIAVVVVVVVVVYRFLIVYDIGEDDIFIGAFVARTDDASFGALVEGAFANALANGRERSADEFRSRVEVGKNRRFFRLRKSLFDLFFEGAAFRRGFRYFGNGVFVTCCLQIEFGGLWKKCVLMLSRLLWRGWNGQRQMKPGGTGSA